MIKAVIFDLDGTLNRGKVAIEGAEEKIEELRSKGVQTIFLTNAATRTRDGFARKMSDMGIIVKEGEMYCSAYFLAKYISQNHKGKKVFVVGEKGIAEELKAMGIEVVEKGTDIVVVGLDRSFTYEKLATAMAELGKGAVLIASNGDATFPTEEGFMPGAGSILSAVEACSGKKAYVVGKPNCYALEVIKEEHNLKNEDILMVGDRLNTDIAFAKTCGIKSAFVLTGVNKKEDIKDVVPDYVFESVAELTLP